MDDLIAFLNARLDEDEAVARESYYEGQRWLTEEEGVYRWPDDELVHSADRKSDARHIARHDPARVLREVAAKRRILGEVIPQIISMDERIISEWGMLRDVPDEHWPLLKLLALPWSDHPDYRAEWKP